VGGNEVYANTANHIKECNAEMNGVVEKYTLRLTTIKVIYL